MRKHMPEILTVLIVSFVMSGTVCDAQQFKLWGTQTRGSSFGSGNYRGNTVTLSNNAKIVRVSRNADGFTLFRDGGKYVTVEKGQDLSGILPPGAYILRPDIGSVTIYLDTSFQAENIILWGRQNAVVKPLWDGNFISLASPTRIVDAHYDGTEGFGIFRNGGTPAFMQYISPHNIRDPGPKVIDASGNYLAKGLGGLVLPQGTYMLVPGRGTGIGQVHGDIVLNVGAPVGLPTPVTPPVVVRVFSQVPKQGSDHFKSARYDAVRIATRSFDRIPYHMTEPYEGTLTVRENQQVLLAGNAEGTQPWYVDNFLLFELSSPEGTARFIIGTVEPVTCSGVKVLQLTPAGFTFGPGTFELAEQFPKGVAVDLKISALDYGGVGGVSDLYLIVR